jgi:hypothetical protein
VEFLFLLYLLPREKEVLYLDSGRDARGSPVSSLISLKEDFFFSFHRVSQMLNALSISRHLPVALPLWRSKLTSREPQREEIASGTPRAHAGKASKQVTDALVDRLCWG